MPDFTKKLDQEFAEQAESYYRDVWSDTHEQWKKTDSFATLTYPIWSTPALNSAREKLYPSTARSTIDHAVDTLLAFSPTLHREPVRDTDESRTWADNVEESLIKILDDATIRSAKGIPTKVLARHFVENNYGILQLSLDSMTVRSIPRPPERERTESDDNFKTRQKLFESQQRSWQPIRFNAPHPSTVLMDPEQRIPPMAIRMMKMTTIDLHEHTKRRKEIHGLRRANVFSLTEHLPFERIELWDVWTANWHMMMEPHNEPLYVERNTWGFVPFIHAFGDFGRIDSENVLNTLAEGILASAEDELVMQARQRNAKNEFLVSRAYANLATTGDPAAMAEQMANDGFIQAEQNEVFQIDLGQIPAGLFALGQETDDSIQLATFSRSLAGVRQAGVSTVGQAAMQSTAAGRRFAGTARQMEFMHELFLGYVLQMSDINNWTIGIRGKRLIPKEIEGVYDIDVTFEILDEAIRIQRQQTASSEFDRGLIDKWTYWEETGRGNATELERRLLRQDIRDMPEIKMILARQIAQEDGIEKEFDEAMALREERGELDPFQSDDTRRVANPGRGPTRGNLNGETAAPARVNIAR